MVITVTVPLVWTTFSDSAANANQDAMDADARAWNITHPTGGNGLRHPGVAPSTDDDPAPKTEKHPAAAAPAPAPAPQVGATPPPTRTPTTKSTLAAPTKPSKPKVTMADLARAGSIVLTFGDSLTHGLSPLEHQSMDAKRYNYPYATYLKKLLGNKAVAIESGRSGELAEQMVGRLPSVLKAYPTTRIGVFLGGTNDLGHHRSAVSIANDMISLHRMMHTWNSSAETSTKNNLPYQIPLSIVLTIPQVRVRVNLCAV